MVGVPYVGAGVTASAVGMDKALFKTIAAQHGLPVADAVVVTPRALGHRGACRPRCRPAALGFPVFVKPARLGSRVSASPGSPIPAISTVRLHSRWATTTRS